jgi:hypothetical protein
MSSVHWCRGLDSPVSDSFYACRSERRKGSYTTTERESRRTQTEVLSCIWESCVSFDHGMELRHSSLSCSRSEVKEGGSNEQAPQTRHTTTTNSRPRTTNNKHQTTENRQLAFDNRHQTTTHNRQTINNSQQPTNRQTENI